MILVDPDWNPQTDCQARERSWRIGQSRDVTIYRLICKGTIEEKIYERQIFKILLSSRILQNARQRAFISRGSYRELFELRDEEEDHDLPTTGDVLPNQDSDVESGCGSDNNVDNRLLRALFDGKSVTGVYDHHALEAQIMSNLIQDAESRAASEIVERAKSRLASSFTGGTNVSSEERDSSFQYTILQRLKEVFEGGAALSSQEVLLRFGDISAEHAPIFREMLRKVARLRDGKWVPLRTP